MKTLLVNLRVCDPQTVSGRTVTPALNAARISAIRSSHSFVEFALLYAGVASLPAWRLTTSGAGPHVWGNSPSRWVALRNSSALVSTAAYNHAVRRLGAFSARSKFKNLRTIYTRLQTNSDDTILSKLRDFEIQGIFLVLCGY